MALSERLSENLAEAESAIRNALVFAARNEKSIVCSTLTKILLDIESIGAYDRISDKIAEQGEDNPFGNLGGLL